MGAWTDRLAAAQMQSSYFAPFVLLGACMLIAAVAPRAISRLGSALSESPISPLEQIAPKTIGAVP
jgi:hypothetical protein